MNTVIDIPTVVSPEAAARVAELGMQAEFDQMIAKARQTLAGLHRLNVVLDPPYDTGDEPSVVIEAFRAENGVLTDPTEREWSHWKITTFSPDIWRHFCLLTFSETPHAR
jgi:hypothetical protein